MTDAFQCFECAKSCKIEAQNIPPPFLGEQFILHQRGINGHLAGWTYCDKVIWARVYVDHKISELLIIKDEGFVNSWVGDL